MKHKKYKLTVTRSQKVNLGNYETKDYFASITWETSKAPHGEMKKGFNFLGQILKKEIS